MNKSAEDRPRILIAAAGTGGHLFPARYIAEALLKISPESEVRFVGAGRPLEAKIIDEAGFAREVLHVEGVRDAGFLGKIRWILNLPRPILECLALFREFNPHVVVGAGGYITVVPVILAWFTGRKSWIHEAETHFGLSTKLLSFFADRISLSYEKTAQSKNKNTIFTGHPLKPTMKHELFVSGRTERTRLLVLGGSQGSRAIDEALMQIASSLSIFGLKEVLHQARPENMERVAEAYKNTNLDTRVVPFIDKIEEVYAWSDIIIARTGAGTTRELLVVHRPTVCVPYPSGEEQYENAQLLVKHKIGTLVPEGEDFAQRLLEALKGILSFAGSIDNFSQNESFDEGAAERIARGILSLYEAQG